MSHSIQHSSASRFHRFDHVSGSLDSLVKRHLVEARTAVMRTIHAAHEDLDELAADQLLAREVDALIGELAEHLQILHRLTQMAGDPRMRRLRR
ncbi:hypothetical protein PYV02_06735 [Leifsonia sp. H3M29-4]|uniref:hypothetical protein n=1 Tax=Salinibacterium metalliresistens TaxID=3031321 RepID=UPI0023DAE582|nr:hypothetical protein [Salinibacterium metalliresistens]MDF1478779.1 hypothetical protein [Salinibacterium metalliresistens]